LAPPNKFDVVEAEGFGVLNKFCCGGAVALPACLFENKLGYDN
jgi:hypothetical protein